MKLCDICSFRGFLCNVQKYGIGLCNCRIATIDAWEPMDKEISFGVPVIAAKVHNKLLPPMPETITFFGKYAVSWPLVQPFLWDSKNYVAWCRLDTIRVTFN